MALRPLLRQRNAAPVMAGAIAAVAIFYPRRAFAESPEAANRPIIPRKPIYDDPTDQTPDAEKKQPSNDSPTSNDSNPSTPAAPSPTDRLTVYVRDARLTVFDLASKAEDQINSVMTRALSLENSFTSTIASLAPPASSGEALMPGLIYVLVAALAGSIFTRNRGIILRATTPLVFGVTAGYAVIPITMRNVGDLAWTYEKRYPAVAEAHLKIKERVEQFWETGKAHTAMTVQMADDKVTEAREKAEEWVKKGK